MGIFMILVLLTADSSYIAMTHELFDTGGIRVGKDLCLKFYAGTVQNFRRQQCFSSLKLHMVASKLHLSIPTSFSENDPDFV